MTTPTMHPLLKLQAVGDRLAGHLAREPHYPVLATAATAEATVRVDAWGLLAGLQVGEPVAPTPELNSALAATLRAAQRALRLAPARRPGMTVTVHRDLRRRFPSWLERIGPGNTEGFDPEHAASVIDRLRGQATAGAGRAVVRPGGAIDSLSVSDVTGRGGAELEADLWLAVRRAADDVAAQVASSSLNPTWAFTRMLLENPYPTPQESR